MRHKCTSIAPACPCRAWLSVRLSANRLPLDCRLFLHKTVMQYQNMGLRYFEIFAISDCSDQPNNVQRCTQLARRLPAQIESSWRLNCSTNRGTTFEVEPIASVSPRRS